MTLDIASSTLPTAVDHRNSGTLVRNLVCRAVCVACGLGADPVNSHALNSAPLDRARQSESAARSRLDECRGNLTTLRFRLDTMTRTLEKVRQAACDADQLQRDLMAARAAHDRLARDAQDAGVTGDSGMLRSRAAVLDQSAATLRAQLDELDRHAAISGQIEAAAADVKRAEVVERVMKALVDRFSEWRNQRMAEQSRGVLDPLRERFRLLFGESSDVQLKIEGAGRGSTFEFLIPRRGHLVPVDDLSGGEMVLASAALLAAMQQIRHGRPRLLLLEGCELSPEALAMCLEALPRLGVDQIVLSTCADVSAAMTGIAGWATVNPMRWRTEPQSTGTRST